MSNSAVSGSSASASLGGSVDGDHSPLLLPCALSKKYFYLSPIANPDLVLTLIIPTHPLYGGHSLPHSPSEAHLRATAEQNSTVSGSSRIAHFFGNVTNTVTNTASGALGVKNSFELNKPRLKLVPRILPTAESNPETFALNQRWMLFKDDGCVYSCVEEKEGGSLYRLGFTKNQMIRVKSKADGQGISGNEADRNHLASPISPNPEVAGASSTDRDMSHTASGLAHAGKGSTSNLGGNGGSHSSKGQLVSVTTAKGDTVIVPRRWDVQKPVTADRIRDLISINGMYVVIEDVDATGATGIGGFIGRAASAAQQAAVAISNAAGAAVNSGGRDTSRLLVIKDICCGNLDCELEKIDAGASCGFRHQVSQEDEDEQKKQSASDQKQTSTAAALSGKSTLETRAGPNIKQIWRVESDFSVWLSTLSRSVATEYGLTRKLQKIEVERKKRREETPDPDPHVPFKLTIDYTYTPIWSTEGTKSAASTPFTIWRPTSASGGVFFGDLAIPSIEPPVKKDALVIAGSGSSSTLHRALVQPFDFQLVYSKKKGKMGNLYIWEPLPPPGVDALALGHIATCGKNEEKPSVQCGLVLVQREYLKLSGHAFSTCLWNDAQLNSGGPLGSFWKVGHMHTFVCHPNSHSPPSGSYHVLLEPQETPEKCPLLRPLETSNAEWLPVWDDKGTLATMDISVWRPKVERSFVRFGDQIVRGHAPPTNLGVVAKDHPAFVRPRSFVLATKFYRGARKCYVWRPIPPNEEYVSLGYVITPTKEEQPQLDCLRCVHKEALIPLGVLKQMWIEHHNGMMSTLTLGVTTLLTISKDYPVNMLWKNRSLNTFMAVQNTHARPDQFAAGNVYRLTMTANELAHTVGLLEKHARWVLESIFITLASLADTLKKSNYERLTLTPKQAATLFQAVKGVFKFLRSEDPSGAAAFNISAEFRAYLTDFENNRLRAVERVFKRHLYQTICADVSDHETTLETLDDCWELLTEMSEVHKTNDEVDQWIPTLSTRFPASQLKPLISLILDDQIGREISEHFITLFPPRAGKGMSAHDEQEDQEDESLHDDKVSNGTPVANGKDRAISTSASASLDSAGALKRNQSVDQQFASNQLAETKETLAKLSTLSAELDTVISVTEVAELRKRYLEYYQTYLTHTLTQEFPVSGSTARSAVSGHKLGMSSLLAIVAWICDYAELVTEDLLEGDQEVARAVLGKMDLLTDTLMDVFDDLAKGKVLGWISNLLRQEERAVVDLRSGEGDDKNKSYYYTSGPSDLFSNINQIFESQSAELKGRPLARVALVHIHVLTYYQQVQGTFFKQLRVIQDNTTHETVKGKTALMDIKHGGSLEKPYSYILAQINNTKLYQASVIIHTDAYRCMYLVAY
jgi:hypothetical protein